MAVGGTTSVECWGTPRKRIILITATLARGGLNDAYRDGLVDGRTSESVGFNCQTDDST